MLDFLRALDLFYPCNALYTAMDRTLIYDERTRGNASYDPSNWQYRNQFEWKRGNALGYKTFDVIDADRKPVFTSETAVAGKVIENAPRRRGKAEYKHFPRGKQQRAGYNTGSEPITNNPPPV